jgi:Predicted glycosyltransferases
VQMCHNPGYGLGNNEGVKKASNETKWVLFLNDDIVLKDDDFIHNMFRLGDSHRETAAAVGCVLTTPKGDELIEAGSIIWNDGSAASFGRGRKDLRAPEFSYPRPVDYVSGACLMVDKSVFLNYGGFDHEDYVNYYEDTDLQMHIQHDLGKEVWVQPLSVALHEEHGSLGNKESLELMNKCHKIFFKKWREKLQKYHLPPPVNLPKIEQELAFLRASDVRGRKSDKASILYVDGDVPNKQMGSGFGRAFDNLSILASLGHRVTVVSLNPVTDGWCDVSCLDRIRQLGIEVITDGWGKFFPAKDRFDFYDIVIVSRPGTFLFTYKKLQKLFTKSPFTLIYDSEALTYRRDETLQHLVKEDGIMFPGMKHFEANLKLGGFFSKQQEITMLSMSDQIVTVSVQETKLVKRQISNSTSAETIGHIMDLNAVTTNSFSQRSGILFLGSFHDNMYYNGDAIWYFLDKIYPLVLKNHDDSPATEPIRLTIAGRDIPLELIKYIAKNATLARHVTFLESPENIDDLMEDTRLFIAPHQYGSGIQYKVRHTMYDHVVKDIILVEESNEFPFTEMCR